VCKPVFEIETIKGVIYNIHNWVEEEEIEGIYKGFSNAGRKFEHI
jgi:hypothetical protein